MDELSLLADVNKWVGVSIALVGSFVVAPDGGRLLWGSLGTTLRRQGNRARATLARMLPFLRRDATARPATIGVTASVPQATAVTSSGRAWRPTAPVDERIEALRQHITEVEGRLNTTAGLLRQETSDRAAAVAELDRTLKADLAELRRLLDEKDRDAALIDARGLPVIGFGILLSGVPETLASIPWHLGWLFPALGVAAATVALAPTVRARFASRRLQSGSSL